MVSTAWNNISQLEGLFPIYGKIKYVPNHQPEMYNVCEYRWFDYIKLHILEFIGMLWKWFWHIILQDHGDMTWSLQYIYIGYSMILM